MTTRCIALVLPPCTTNEHVLSECFLNLFPSCLDLCAYERFHKVLGGEKDVGKRDQERLTDISEEIKRIASPGSRISEQTNQGAVEGEVKYLWKKPKGPQSRYCLKHVCRMCISLFSLTSDLHLQLHQDTIISLCKENFWNTENFFFFWFFSFDAGNPEARFPFSQQSDGKKIPFRALGFSFKATGSRKTKVAFFSKI